MTAEQFAYWMQGFAELSGDTPPTPEQWQSIREHLALVFTKVTPPLRAPSTPPRYDYMPLKHFDTTVTCLSGGSAPLTYC